MSELVNLMSGISGVTVQARDIGGGIHLHLTVPDPFRSDAARSVDLDEQTADALASVFRDLEGSLTALGVPEADLADAVDQVTRAVLLEFRKEHDSTPRTSSVTLTPELRRFVNDLAAYVEPRRLLAHSFYFSSRKVVAFHRTYQDQLPGTGSPDSTQRFLALLRYFRARDQLLFAPTRLPEVAAPDDRWVFFTGRFTLTRDDDALDRIPGARAEIASRSTTNLFHIVTTIFGAKDPFFYPYVEFRGHVGSTPAVMVASRKHLVLGSATVAALSDALRGVSFAVAGFATLGPEENGVRRLHPIAFRLTDRY